MAGDNTGAPGEDAERGLRRAERRPAVLDALARAEIGRGTNEDWAAADGHLKQRPGAATGTLQALPP